LSREHALLEVVELPEDGRVRVRLCGELDLSGTPAVTERLRSLREHRQPVLLDLDELEFIDMSGLRALRAAADDAAGDGLTFGVTRGSPALRRLLALVDGSSK
jgi:anti-anti-sigma factor